MLDFVSTRATTDEQTAKCAKLLAAVIAQAIRDACAHITAETSAEQRRRDANAREAILFLFGPDSVFPLYAALIGSSAYAIRAALMALAAADDESVPMCDWGLSDDARGALHTRLRGQGVLQDAS